MDPPEDDRMLTVDEVAERLQVKRNHVYALIAAGKLEAKNIGAGKRKVYRIRASWVRAFLEAS